MSSIMIIGRDNEVFRRLKSELVAGGFAVSLVTDKERALEKVVRESPELIMVEVDGMYSRNLIKELTRGNKIPRIVPSIALLNNLNQLGDDLNVDDFMVFPFDSHELAIRAKRLLQRHSRQEEIIDCGELKIDLANCEVRVQGKIVELTFKEYELLKFMAKQPGRVFTRETLLNKVWGYDYFGGDRTVDVHIRRLRSKIEISGKTFIETVRNIGYRFKKTL